jgi:hypothetical protein
MDVRSAIGTGTGLALTPISRETGSRLRILRGLRRGHTETRLCRRDKAIDLGPPSLARAVGKREVAIERKHCIICLGGEVNSPSPKTS